MSYDKVLVSNKQKAVLKSITDLLNVLSEIEVGSDGDNSGEITLDDGSIMTLSIASDKDPNSSHIQKLSVTNARLNLDITVRKQNDNVIRLVKRKPGRIIVKLKKKDG